MSMSMCRTCLKTPADKHILELEKDIRDCNKDSFHIMVFCLDIKVSKDSKITMNLCNNCYRKIISFYKFKALSLKNDAYLKSLDPVMQLEDYQVSLYVDENGIKHENFLDPDEFGPSLVEKCDKEFKIEIDVKEGEDVEINVKKEEELQDVESDEEPLNKVQKVKYENAEDNSKKNATVKKKRGRPKKQQSKKTKEPLSKIQKVKYKNIKNDSKINTTVKKKLGRPKKSLSEKIKEELLVCEECGKSVRCLKAHSVLHQPKGERPVFHCKLCPKFFVTESGLNRHHKTVHLGTSSSHKTKSMCEICNKEVKHLNNHIQMMHKRETLPFGCVTCERRFFSRSALQIHMARHVGVIDRPFECDICQKRYRFKSEVSNHIRKIHQNEKNYQCDICSRTFFDKQPFICHLESHTDKPLYKCNKCGLALKTQATLWRHHKIVHKGVRNFHCTLCTKSFKLPSADKPLYKCNKCGLALKTQATLWRHHKIVHKGVRNFHCTLCTKSFKLPSVLKSHMLTHTKERPFQCQYCDMRLRRLHHLKRHELAHKKNTLRPKKPSSNAS